MKSTKELECLAGTPGRLGVSKEGPWVHFSAVFEEEEAVSLLLYRKGSGEILTEIPFPEEGRAGKLWSMKVKGLKTAGLEYNFRAGDQVVCDPCAARIVGREAFGVPAENADGHQIRCGFLSEYYWEEDERLKIPWEDAVMYSLHVRNFTMQPGSGVRHRGTFAGVKEKADYLKELGINQVKLMPAYEFDEIVSAPAAMKAYAKAEEMHKVNCWGYLEGCYFAPKASYAAAKDPTAEFRDLVKTFHKKGIEVLMEFYFPAGVSPRLVTDCLAYWVKEYHVDGFHIFGDPFLARAAACDPALADVKLLNTYFPVEEIYGTKPAPHARNLAECNEGFLYDVRRFLKGDGEGSQGFAWRMRRNPKDTGLVNYITSHDGFTLMDLVSYNERHNEANGEQGRDGTKENYSWNCGEEGPTKKRKVCALRRRQMKNALTMLILSAGTPMLLAGDEFGNSQDGNNNPYCIDGPVSWVDWGALRRNKDLMEYVKGLIAFRKEHRILHMKEELKGADGLACGYPDISYHGARAWYGAFEEEIAQEGILYCGQYAGENEFVYAAYNLCWDTRSFALPHLPGDMEWYVALSSETGVAPAGEEPPLGEAKSFEVPGRTVVVLVGRA